MDMVIVRLGLLHSVGFGMGRKGNNICSSIDRLQMKSRSSDNNDITTRVVRRVRAKVKCCDLHAARSPNEAVSSGRLVPMRNLGAPAAPPRQPALATDTRNEVGATSPTGAYEACPAVPPPPMLSINWSCLSLLRWK